MSEQVQKIAADEWKEVLEDIGKRIGTDPSTLLVPVGILAGAALSGEGAGKKLLGAAAGGLGGYLGHSYLSPYVLQMLHGRGKARRILKERANEPGLMSDVGDTVTSRWPQVAVPAGAGYWMNLRGKNKIINEAAETLSQLSSKDVANFKNSNLGRWGIPKGVDVKTLVGQEPAAIKTALRQSRSIGSSLTRQNLSRIWHTLKPSPFKESLQFLKGRGAGIGRFLYRTGRALPGI